MSEARKLQPDSFAAARVGASDKISPFIRRTSKGIEYAGTLTEKRDLVRRMRKNEIVIWPWGGRWATDVFELSVEEARELVSP